MKKILLILFVLLLSACGTNNNISINNTEKKEVSLPSISTGNVKGLLVGVTDPHIYSKKGPLVISGSYYFNPKFFYIPILNLNEFQKAYYKGWNGNKVYYYDENNGAQAGLVVYILRNYYKLKNVSLLESSFIYTKLKYNQKIYSIPPFSKFNQFNVTGGYIGTGKYLIVYDPKLIEFKTGDLLLYSCDKGTMKQDSFYQNSTGVNIKSFYWSSLIDVKGGLKSKTEIEKFLKPLELEKYNRVFIYYPKAWYRSGVLALYLQENYKK